MRLSAGATALQTLQLAAVVNSAQLITVENVRALDGSAARTVTAIVGGVALSVYKATIVATPIRG